MNAFSWVTFNQISIGIKETRHRSSESFCGREKSYFSDRKFPRNVTPAPPFRFRGLVRYLVLAWKCFSPRPGMSPELRLRIGLGAAFTEEVMFPTPASSLSPVWKHLDIPSVNDWAWRMQYTWSLTVKPCCHLIVLYRTVSKT